MDMKPPRFARKILLTFLREDLAEEVLGDLEERFCNDVTKKSRRKAQLNYWYQVINYLRPFALRNVKRRHINQIDMYKSYVIIGWRNLLKNTGYSAINIGGLTLGMAVALLIGLWVYDELSFNKYHDNYEKVTRVMRNGTLNGETFSTPYLPYPLAEEMRSSYGNYFKHVAMAMPVGEHSVSEANNRILSKGMYIEPEGAEMLTLKMIHGTRDGLKDPHSILLSASLSQSLFGSNDPLGKAVKIDGQLEAIVTGVYENLPDNTHFHEVAFFAPWKLFLSANPWVNGQRYSNNFVDVYAQLNDGVSVEQASEQIKDIVLKNIADNPEYVAANPQLFLHPMSKWHLYTGWKNGAQTGGQIQFVWLFGVIGVFVLILACINFMNLSTARSEKRAREVGLRKVMGSLRGQLVGQFFAESFVVVIASFVFSLLVVVLSLNVFNDLAGKQILMPWSNPYLWLFSSLFVIITGLLAGSYPAMYLSSFQPIKVLKGILKTGASSLPRKALVVVQFTVSVTLVIGTIVVYQQIQFAKNRILGFEKNGLIMIRKSNQEFWDKSDVIRNELKNVKGVEEVGESGGKITSVWSSQGGFTWKGKDPDQQAEFATLNVSPEFGKTVGWKFIDGRDFSRMAGDSTAFVITKSAAALMNMKDPVGEIVHWEAGWRKGYDFKVIGVIDDLVMESPFANTMPTVFFLTPWNSWVNIRLSKQTEPQEALSAIEKVFTKVLPSVTFDYEFADAEYNAKFIAEERIGKLATVFATLAIVISCLGLFGLASYVAEQRMKEIGIRKILGASRSELWRLLSTNFAGLTILASILAIPLAYYLLEQWLAAYAYRIQISPWVYALSTTGAFVITLLTISFQTIKATLLNPIDIIRTE